MKKILALMAAPALVMGLSLTFSVQADAALIVRGTDTLGYQLIYDTDRDITWYDYTHAVDTWQNQVNWADALSVNFGGTIYDDWRLPITDENCTGYNCTGSEWAHLYYTELNNKAGGQLGNTNTGPFNNLQSYYYWSGTEDSADSARAWGFYFPFGHQGVYNKDNWNFYAMAVRPGDVSTASVPEPATLLLLGSGLAGMFVWRQRAGKTEA
jgi:hypothetical protein